MTAALKYEWLVWVSSNADTREIVGSFLITAAAEGAAAELRRSPDEKSYSDWAVS